MVALDLEDVKMGEHKRLARACVKRYPKSTGLRGRPKVGTPGGTETMAMALVYAYIGEGGEIQREIRK